MTSPTPDPRGICGFSTNQSMNNTNDDGYFSSSQSEGFVARPVPLKNAGRKRKDNTTTAKISAGPMNGKTTAPSQSLWKNRGGKQCNKLTKTRRGKKYEIDKENKDPRVGQRKTRSKSINNTTFESFGRGVHPRAGKFRTISPKDKPMILSRRLSYRINNSTPGRSPITAHKLIFSPMLAADNSKRRKSRRRQSSLERVGKPDEATKSRLATKRYSV